MTPAASLPSIAAVCIALVIATVTVGCVTLLTKPSFFDVWITF